MFIREHFFLCFPWRGDFWRRSANKDFLKNIRHFQKCLLASARDVRYQGRIQLVEGHRNGITAIVNTLRNGKLSGEAMYLYPKQYEVIVIGAGHAGIEAALAAARLGCQTLLLTLNLDTIGQMSCNPAIGGMAKGHLVREIDALGGEMGKTTDLTGIQFRMLNKSKGPSVWAPRAQCDKKAYQLHMKWVCERERELDCKQAQTVRILEEDGGVCGVETSMQTRYIGECVVVTTGTFLCGLMHVGQNRQAGGRAGEPAALNLSDSLRKLGIELARFKTGTPPRLVKRSIDFSSTQIQLGDDPPPFFSFWKEKVRNVPRGTTAELIGSRQSVLEQIGGQVPCYLTHTTAETVELVRQNLHKSAMYSGLIRGVGPRYCPSIEDKIVRFSEKEQHQIFLEPEGFATDEIYVNGFSTSLPYDVQVRLVRTIKGCENAEIMRPAYAVEYDYAPPSQLRPSLESKYCRNLFLAGQINGTSGYEEAAAQGLIAGINAARRVKDLEPIILARDQAYIGVLIDDLTTSGTTEPYRMFTSRAEYRLTLRQDNADLRLSQIGYEIGLLSQPDYERVCVKRNQLAKEMERLERERSGTETLAHLLRRPHMSYRDLPSQDSTLSQEVIEQVELLVKYSGYLARQEAEVQKLKAFGSKPIPQTFDYQSVIGLRHEAFEKLSAIRPDTIGQAARVSGISPADISLLLVHLKRAGKAGESKCSDCGSK